LLRSNSGLHAWRKRPSDVMYTKQQQQNGEKNQSAHATDRGHSHIPKRTVQDHYSCRRNSVSELIFITVL